MNWSFIPQYLPYFNDGLIMTLIISIFVVFFGAILGTILALGKISRHWFFRWPANIYIEVFRGTPMLVQITIGFLLLGNVFKGSPLQLGILSEPINSVIAGIIILVLNSGAYVAEIVRAGISSIPKGQTEAAYSLGIKPTQTMLSVILPQAIRNILPALGNEFVTIIKDSSLLSTIGVIELYSGGQTVISSTYISLEPLLLVAGYYFVVTFVTTRLLALLEKRYAKGLVK
ncbi:amino acid ABC transporter permease [Lactococcus termiticola]|uniref:Glutamine ABC transporter permease protein n=1 Tax=Lactococcus termiticola TaxID=2169526 RepID=A0A2R5HHY8_9LACT|nr:amino acid ABC transporter permease [Lactococcus termiticola]GBG97546.1 glutamine ABC transporter permease protein [Lactococcus termiticola]